MDRILRQMQKIPLSVEGEAIAPGKEPLLAPGVRGYAIEKDGVVYIPLIVAEKEGSGDVGRFLDGLEEGYRYVIPDVLNPRLAWMLLRRGWTLIEGDGSLFSLDLRLRGAVRELLRALGKVQDWSGTRVGDAMERIEELLP